MNIRIKNIRHILFSSAAMGMILFSSAQAKEKSVTKKAAEEAVEKVVIINEQENPAAKKEKIVAKVESDNPVIAKIGDVPIFRDSLMIIHRNLPEPWNVYDFESLFPALQDNAIDLELARQLGMEKALDKTEEYKQNLEYYKAIILYEIAINQYLEENLTEERLKTYYQERIKEFEPEEERKMRHILVETEEDAQKIIERLDAGEDFSKVAIEASIGPSGQNGGNLNWAAAGEYVPEFSEVAWALEVGKYSHKPVKTTYGYHIIIVDETRETQPPQYEDVKGLLEGELNRDLKEQFFQELSASKEILRFDVNGDEIVEPVAPEEREPLDEDPEKVAEQLQ